MNLNHMFLSHCLTLKSYFIFLHDLKDPLSLLKRGMNYCIKKLAKGPENNFFSKQI